MAISVEEALKRCLWSANWREHRYSLGTLNEMSVSPRGSSGIKIDLEAPYQRGVSWTPENQAMFMGHLLAGGFVPMISARSVEIEPGSGAHKMLEIIDGKQRLSAIKAFFAGDIDAVISQHGGVRVSVSDVQSHQSGLLATSWVLGIIIRESEMSQSDAAKVYGRMNRGHVPHTETQLEHAGTLSNVLDGFALPEGSEHTRLVVSRDGDVGCVFVNRYMDEASGLVRQAEDWLATYGVTDGNGGEIRFVTSKHFPEKPMQVEAWVLARKEAE